LQGALRPHLQRVRAEVQNRPVVAELVAHYLAANAPMQAAGDQAGSPYVCVTVFAAVAEYLGSLTAAKGGILNVRIASRGSTRLMPSRGRAP